MNEENINLTADKVLSRNDKPEFINLPIAKHFLTAIFHSTGKALR